MTPPTEHSRAAAWTLITVTYNSAMALDRYWRTELGPDVDWVVVDNASRDHSADLAEHLGAKVVRLPKNVGFGAANNVGFASSDSPYVAFVNPDVRVDTTDLPRLAEELNRAPNALVAPQLVNDDGTPQANGRGLPYLAHKIRNRTAPERLEGSYLRFADPGETVAVEWLMGAVVAGHRKHLATLGPWDERFFVYYEDSDLGLRNSRVRGSSKVVGDVQWTHGWARETTAPSLSAWKREIPSLLKFYSRYPRLLGVPPRSR